MTLKMRKANLSDLDWFTKLTSYYTTDNFVGIVALLDDGARGGMMGMDFWTPKSVQLHIALNTMEALPDLWRETVSFLRSKGRNLVYCVTPSDHLPSIGLQRAAGFRETYRLVDGWDHGVDMVLSERRI